MKKIIVLSLLVSNVTFASGRPGSQVEHKLNCLATNQPVGVQVSVSVFTQALPPQYNTRGMSVSVRPVYPNARAQTTKLKEASQTAYNAVFKAEKITAELDKARFEVNLQLGSVEYKCK